MQIIYGLVILLACWIAAYVTWDSITHQLERERAEVHHG